MDELKMKEIFAYRDAVLRRRRLFYVVYRELMHRAPVVEPYETSVEAIAEHQCATQEEVKQALKDLDERDWIDYSYQDDKVLIECKH